MSTMKLLLLTSAVAVGLCAGCTTAKAANCKPGQYERLTDPTKTTSWTCVNGYNLGDGTATTGDVDPAESEKQGGTASGTLTTDDAGNLASDGGKLQGQVDTNTSNISTNTTNIGKNTTAIADHEDRITTNTSNISTLQTWAGHVDDHLGVVDDRLNGHDDAIKGLNATTASHSAAIASLRGDVGTLYKLNAIALAMPDAYLQAHERVSFAGGAGFNGDQTGFGAVGAIRFDKNWSGYGGVAFSDGEVAGKVGARVGW